MIEFNFKSQIATTIEQSERLIALGLRKETADMYITNMSRKGLNYTDDWQIGSISYCDVMSFWDSKGLQLEKTDWSIIPAWSLHRLIEILDTNPFVFYLNCGYDNVIDHVEEYIRSGFIDTRYLEEWCLNEEE